MIAATMACSIGFVTPRYICCPRNSNVSFEPTGGRLKSPGPGGVKPSDLATVIPIKLTVSPVCGSLLAVRLLRRRLEAGPRQVDPQARAEENSDHDQPRRPQPPIEPPADQSVHEDSRNEVAERMPRVAPWTVCFGPVRRDAVRFVGRVRRRRVLLSHRAPDNSSREGSLRTRLVSVGRRVGHRVTGRVTRLVGWKIEGRDPGLGRIDDLGR